MNIGREALPDCHKAEESLIEAAQRFENTQRMGLSGPGLYALRHVIERHDLQRSSIARSKLLRCHPARRLPAPTNKTQQEAK